MNELCKMKYTLVSVTPYAPKGPNMYRVELISNSFARPLVFLVPLKSGQDYFSATHLFIMINGRRVKMQRGFVAFYVFLATIIVLNTGKKVYLFFPNTEPKSGQALIMGIQDVVICEIEQLLMSFKRPVKKKRANKKRST